ncbi:hypothetical protein DFH94DRAFT_416213 [Russula ochroleuca]|uniref:Uncharacterized protein n=1 Tax=Russula ochroleuca TaxID=152965 RepID=A0A9P5MYX0_9AGAM|nr:hypothetical protein DFH94DRAFT_416213 [Russula ochroleuca]
MENIPPALAADPFTSLPKAPSSPTKRPPSTSHYTGGDCSPSKKRDLGSSKPTMAKLSPDERGLLFADATNSSTKDVEDGIDESNVPVMRFKATGTKRVKRGPSKKRKVEVVIPVTTQHELNVDVFT